MYISLPRGVEVGKEVGDQEESMWEVQLRNAECTHTHESRDTCINDPSTSTEKLHS